VTPVLALYGHPFSSYTWKAQIAFHAAGVNYEFREVGPDQPANGEFLVSHAGPWGKFPVLVDGEQVLFEATVIIEHLASTMRRRPDCCRAIPLPPCRCACSTGCSTIT